MSRDSKLPMYDSTRDTMYNLTVTFPSHFPHYFKANSKVSDPQDRCIHIFSPSEPEHILKRKPNTWLPVAVDLR